MSDEPRYYVVELQGRTIRPGGKDGMWGTSYSVLDRCQNHAEVFTRYCGAVAFPNGGQRVGWKRRREAYRECERLNNLDATRGVL